MQFLQFLNHALAAHCSTAQLWRVNWKTAIRIPMGHLLVALQFTIPAERKKYTRR